MKKKLFAGILGVAVLAVSLLAGCESINSTSSDRTYTIACDNAYAPFSVQINGTYKGIDVDLISAISKTEGFKYTLKPMTFSGVIPALKANQIDGAIAGMSITDERKKSVDFSDGYYHSTTSVITDKNNTAINSLSDLNGKTVAVKKGTTGAAFAEQNQAKYHLQISYFDDSPSMFQAVQNKNADFCLEDYPVVSYKIKVDPSCNLKIAIKEANEGTYFGFAVNKGTNKQLLKMFNDGLKKLKANGQYDKIVNQYI